MEHTISRNNAQDIICFICALLRNVWGRGQTDITSLEGCLRDKIAIGKRFVFRIQKDNLIKFQNTYKSI